MSTGLSQEQVAQLGSRIQDLLNQRSRARGLGFALEVREPFVLEEEIVTFIVLPDPPGVRADDYADVLTEVETLLRQEGYDLLLVPAHPD